MLCPPHRDSQPDNTETNSLRQATVTGNASCRPTAAIIELADCGGMDNYHADKKEALCDEIPGYAYGGSGFIDGNNV